jgi:hypothetical protein
MKREYMNNADTMIIGILNCLFAKSPEILQHFRNFEETFEKSSIISTIISILALYKIYDKPSPIRFDRLKLLQVL